MGREGVGKKRKEGKKNGKKRKGEPSPRVWHGTS